VANAPVHVTVTGAAGQIGYALVHRVAHGDLLGPDQPIVLRLLEIEPALPALEGVVMELEDGAHQLLEGRANNEHAASDVRVLVVGNPCNTNCLIARSNAPDVPADRWFAMTRLDENRAKSQLAKKAGVAAREVTNMAIWGNHSTTQFPDFVHARIGGKPAPDVIGDVDWLRGPFLEIVQKRGAAVIDKRGASSAASAAHAALDSVRSVVNPTPAGDWHSLAVASRGEYGVPEGLQFGFPVRSDGTGWSIVDGIEHDEWAREKIDITTNELLEERAEVQELLRA
jgi:malate dehydrogenase